MPKPTQWGYDPRIHNFRNLSNGRIVSRKKVQVWSDDFIDTTGKDSDALADLLISGTIDLGEWETRMRKLIKETYSAEFMLGRGGLEQMTFRDWGILGHELRDQYEFLNNFSNDIFNGTQSPAQIKNRARMYIDGAHKMFQRGRTEAFGMPRLPAYDGDGQQQCLNRGRCTWLIQPVYENKMLAGWNATWVLDPNAQHCTDCPENARLWNPLFVPAGMNEKEADIWRKDQVEKMLRARG